ncbi:MAG: Maf family protein [Lachnospiraceae bacterium]
MNKFILASASPRRSELLQQIGMSFSVCKSTCEEKISSTVPSEVVCELSRQKAEDVWKRMKSDEISAPSAGQEKEQETVVIGADTIVAFDGRILGKPKDEAEACAMLSQLSGHTHEVYTGVTFCYKYKGEERVHTFFEKTEVDFYPMSREEIERYVATKDPLDKAGAYGIQGQCAAYIRGIRGDYNNVVGLPVGRLYQELKECLGE